MEQFQLSVERNLGFCRFCFTTVCDWPREPAPHSRPSRYESEVSCENVSPAFTRASGHLLLFNVSFLWPQNFVLFRVVPMKFVLRSVIVTKTCATISANQMQNKTIANLSHAFSRALLSPFDLLYIQL